MRRSEKMRLNLQRRRDDYEKFSAKVSNKLAYRKPGSNKKGAKG